MRYFRFRYKSIDEAHPDWGYAWEYTEYAPSGYPNRVVYVFHGGVRLRYGPHHYQDDYRGIVLITLDEAIDAGDEEMGAAEFEQIWQSGPWLNEEPR